MSTPAPNILAQIQALIAHPSVSCTDPGLDQGNRGVIDLLANWLDGYGFAVQVIEVAPGKANLLASLGGQAGIGEGLVLAGHTDTVPYDLGRWSTDPFAGREKDGRVYGLGSCDMKGFFPLAMAAALTFDPKTLRRPVTILATADEESSMSGAKQLRAAGLRPGRFAVIGEPTGLKPIRLHKGVMMESIRITGQAGHSSDPALGANAIEGMQLVLAELLRWRAELQERYRNPAFHVTYPTLNFGSIHGGDNPNRICPHCEMQIDIRPLPGMSLTELREAMAARLQAALGALPRLQLHTAALFDGLEPFETPADSALVRECRDLTGIEAGAVAFGTEAPFLTRLGMETVVLGPGDIDQAHQADEYLALDRIEPMIGILRGLIRRFCVVG
ncbi:MAG: acetylornithine deacetylase [Methylococcaceae bacterium]|nr:acetylornithine deacetylase [Methylococcaceae bacterium]